jgi:hypothetical protein
MDSPGHGIAALESLADELECASIAAEKIARVLCAVGSSL